VTAELVKAMVEQQFMIVSGFMYGVDAIAHQTCLDHLGKTIAVIGFGFEHLYPKSHRVLYQQLLDKEGLILSEYLPNVQARPEHFPARNRIVAGLSLGVLVVEAAVDSGSKITAQYAGEYGREVFAVPGSIYSKYSEGTKELINSGATLVTSANDILSVLCPQSQGFISQNLQLQNVFQELCEQLPGFSRCAERLLNGEALSVHEMLDLAPKISLTELHTLLTTLEMQGSIINNLDLYSLNRTGQI
jgi:DNA processing protein